MFQGKIALVVGGSQGIGLAIAQRLAAEGAAVVLAARTTDRLEVAAEGIAAAGGHADWVRVDVGDPGSVGAMVRTILERHGHIDLLVLAAGIGRFGLVTEMSLTDWEEVMGSNLTGAFHCIREALPHMLSRREGAILFISSGAAKLGRAQWSAYCASKAGLHAFAEAVADEVRNAGIRVHLIVPGAVRTEFWRGADPGTSLQAEDVAEIAVATLRLPSEAMVEEVRIRPRQSRRSGS